MDRHKDVKNVENDEFQFVKKQPSKWPRVIGFFGMLGLSAVLLVAFCTFEIGSIAMAFISDQTLRPVVLLVVVLAALVGLYLLP
jgi:hypothetical protein